MKANSIIDKTLMKRRCVKFDEFSEIEQSMEYKINYQKCNENSIILERVLNYPWNRAKRSERYFKVVEIQARLVRGKQSWVTFWNINQKLNGSRLLDDLKNDFQSYTFHSLQQQYQNRIESSVPIVCNH